MDFDLPTDLTAYLAELDAFIEAEIRPLEAVDDNIRFFDHRREHARTDWDRGGLPRHDWEALLAEARRRADAAGHLRFGMPVEFGGRNGSNLAMAVIREHFAAKGLGLHNDLQNEHSIVANNPIALMLRDFGTEAQKALIAGSFDGSFRCAFGLTEPEHGSDATFMETVAKPQSRDGVAGYVVDGEKMWTTGMHVATHCLVFARTSGEAGDARGITCLMVPSDAPGVKVEEYLWTFNMPTDHPRVSFTDVWVPEDADTLGPEDGRGLAKSHSCSYTRTASAKRPRSLGAPRSTASKESVKLCAGRASRSASRSPTIRRSSGRSSNLPPSAEMLRQLIRKTAWEMDRMSKRDGGLPDDDLGQGVDVQLPGRTGWCAKPPIGRCRCTAAWAIRATSRSSTSIAITAAIASPRAPRRSRCARSPPTCSASLDRGKRCSRRAEVLRRASPRRRDGEG